MYKRQTFDSTPRGNIGPVAKAIMDELGETKTILCPALPVNKRTVIRGRLYVDGVPLDESPMKNHPVNPMWEKMCIRDRFMNEHPQYQKYRSVVMSDVENIYELLKLYEEIDICLLYTSRCV